MNDGIINLINNIENLFFGCIQWLVIAYAVVAHFLPAPITLHDFHPWWYNLILGIAWFGLYLFLANSYKKLIMHIYEVFNEYAQDNFECDLFPRKIVLSYIGGTALILGVIFWKWAVWLLFVGVAGIVVPIIYYIVIARRNSIFIFLRQLAMILLIAIGTAIFLPIASIFIILYITMLVIGAGASTYKKTSYCPHCGAQLSQGEECPCGKSVGV